MKFASYLLGTMRGQKLNLDHLPETKELVHQSWFKEYFLDLERILNEIMDSYGNWPSQEPFERIGTLVERVVEANGVFAKETEDGGAEVRVPFTPDTYPLFRDP